MDLEVLVRVGFEAQFNGKGACEHTTFSGKPDFWGEVIDRI